MNERDSEQVSRMLESRGYRMTQAETEATPFWLCL